MNWKLKAQIQNTISLLPQSNSHSMYYFVQKYFGGIRNIKPINKLTAAIDVCKKIVEQNHTPKNKVFLEVGTGKVAMAPIAYWLMGADKTITIDLNPYLKSELVEKCLQYICNNRTEVKNIFGELLVDDRFEMICKFMRSDLNFSLPQLLDMCSVEYISPGDASKTGLRQSSIDYHTSYNVLEHIPSKNIKNIFLEGNRIIKPNGLFIHNIDYSDHFSHSDINISAINFLQYSDSRWNKIAGNRYMYMNRLRHDDFLDIYNSVGHAIIDCQPTTDLEVINQLNNNSLNLDNRFSSKSLDILSTTSSWMISKKNEP